jgi:hypothetical protein
MFDKYFIHQSVCALSCYDTIIIFNNVIQRYITMVQVILSQIQQGMHNTFNNIAEL